MLARSAGCADTDLKDLSGPVPASMLTSLYLHVSW